MVTGEDWRLDSECARRRKVHTQAAVLVPSSVPTQAALCFFQYTAFSSRRDGAPSNAAATVRRSPVSYSPGRTSFFPCKVDRQQAHLREFQAATVCCVSVRAHTGHSHVAARRH